MVLGITSGQPMCLPVRPYSPAAALEPGGTTWKPSTVRASTGATIHSLATRRSWTRLGHWLLSLRPSLCLLSDLSPPFPIFSQSVFSTSSVPPSVSQYLGKLRPRGWTCQPPKHMENWGRVWRVQTQPKAKATSPTSVCLFPNPSDSDPLSPAPCPALSGRCQKEGA